MTAPVIVSAELAASIARMRSRSWRDDEARAFEDGTARTKPATTAGAPIGAASRPSRFLPRQRQRSPDRQASRDRRRMLGGSAVMPPNLRTAYTEGQRAVLTIVAGEVKHHGVCDLPIDKIAALAGVCRTTVQTTLHEARRLFHIRITERPRPGQKNLTNVVEIIAPEWVSWLKRGPSAHRPSGSSSVKMVSATKNTDHHYSDAARVEGRQAGNRGVPWARSGAHSTSRDGRQAMRGQR